MNLIDAVSSLQLFKRKEMPKQLTTVWGEQLDPEHVLEEYPRPQLRRDAWINLNGFWNYRITKDRKYPGDIKQQILVPFSPEAALSQVNHTLMPDEYLWYEKSFHISLLPGVNSKTPSGQRLILHFGAVDQTCSVWCNKKFIRSHQGGYLPFSADITQSLRSGENTITVRVQDETDTSYQSRGKQTLQPGGMFYTPQSGIWQTVWMEWVPENYISSIRITPQLDESSAVLEITIQGDPACEKNITVYAEGREIYSVQTQKESQTIPIRDLRPWTPESPFLYDIVITAGDDRVSSYFAMRKFSSCTDSKGIPRLCLNNQPYFQNGVLDQGYWPDGLYTPPSDEAMIFDIQAMKDLGFNMIRKHIKIEPLRWYHHCDRLGMIVWQDIVNGGGRSYLTFLCYLPTLLPFVTAHFKDSHYKLFSRCDSKGKRLWLRECKATVEHLYNCPSIGLWSAFNEGWGQFDAVKVTNLIHSLDSTRPVDHASGWYDQHCGDVKSVHNYFRPIKAELDSRPFVLSEYGGYICHIPEHSYSQQVFGYLKCKDTDAFTRKFQDVMEEIRAANEEGLCAAVYTQVSDVEEEANGLYSYDRKVCKVNMPHNY